MRIVIALLLMTLSIAPALAWGRRRGAKPKSQPAIPRIATQKRMQRTLTMAHERYRNH